MKDKPLQDHTDEDIAELDMPGLVTFAERARGKARRMDIRSLDGARTVSLLEDRAAQAEAERRRRLEAARP